MDGSNLPLPTIAITWVSGIPLGRETKPGIIFVDVYSNTLAGMQVSRAYKSEDIYGRDGRSKVARRDVEAASSRGH